MEHAPATVELVDALPKAELHVHLEGSMLPATLLRLRERHGIASLPATLDDLEHFFAFRDFPHFIEVYFAVVEALQEPDDIRLLVEDLATELARQNVRWAEVTTTPTLHTRRGLDGGDVAAALEEGRRAVERDHGVRLRWVADLPGHFGVPAAEETLDWALTHRPDGLIGFGIGGPEVDVPRPPFADVFARARAAGLHSLPHAGETTGAQTVRDAIEALGAERIGHGVRCLEDPVLVAEMVERRIPLEVCPTSNVCLGVVGSLAEHPLRRLIDAGLVVTLNSDDPPMFGTTLRDEYLEAVTELGLSHEELVDIARAGVRCSFMPEPDKATLLAEIDAVAAGT